ncbi:MAG: MFS transporter, partial [Pseudomonadota bacterium]
MADAAQPRELPAKRIIAFVFTTVFLNMVGFGLIIPIMPTLMVDVTGAGISNAARYTGILYVVFALGQFIFSPILGGLSDRYGRRPVLLVSLTFYALDFLLLAVAPTFAWLVVARVLSGVTSATYATANAVIADVLPPKERAGTFGLTGAAFGLGFIIGPVIGGSLAEFGVRTPFYVGAALGGINVLFGLIAMPETLKTKRAFSWRRANPLGSIYAASRHAGVVLVLISMFLVQFAYQALPSVFAFFATLTFGWTPLHISYALAFVGLTSATVQVGLVRRVTAKIGEARA